MLKTTVFELMQQFYHATEVGNVDNAANACADQPLTDKIKTIVSDKVNHRGTQSLNLWTQAGSDTRGGMQGMHPPTRPKKVLTWHLISLKIIAQNIFVLYITR